MARAAADFMAEVLQNAGVRRVYGVVGDSLNGFTDALRRIKSIDWIHVRHEEAAAFAAGSEAHLTGELAVCAGSCGPGNLHLINGLYDCHRSRVPVLAIAAHIPSREIGIDYFQATHPERLFAECSHYVELVSSPEQLPQILERAMRTAIGRRGVAVVVVPGDVALASLDAPPPVFIGPPKPVLRPSEHDLQRLASLLNDAGAVTLLCGAGCAGAHAEVTALAKLTKAPIVHPLRGKEHVEYDNPLRRRHDRADRLFLRLCGHDELRHAADAGYRLSLPAVLPGARAHRASRRPAGGAGQSLSLELGLIGDVKETLLALMPHLVAKTDSSHLDNALADYKKARQGLDALAESNPGSDIIHPQYVARLVSELAADDAIFTCDVGTPTVWAARYLKMNGKRRLIGSFNHGSMANAMLQAIGAQAALPGRQVVSLSGNGGFTMMMGDFITLTQVGLPVKVVVFNNGTLGFVELEMKASGLLDVGCDLKNPNFAAMAEAMGVKGVRVEKPDDLEGALTAALRHDGPALVDVLTARQELVLPPKTTFGQAYAFNLFLLKAVMNGRADQLIDLAKVNLWR